MFKINFCWSLVKVFAVIFDTGQNPISLFLFLFIRWYILSFMFLLTCSIMSKFLLILYISAHISALLLCPFGDSIVSMSCDFLTQKSNSNPYWEVSTFFTSNTLLISGWSFIASKYCDWQAKSTVQSLACFFICLMSILHKKISPKPPSFWFRRILFFFLWYSKIDMK